MRFPGGTVVKNLPVNAGDARDLRRLDSWVRKIPQSMKHQPTPIFLPGEFHGQRSLVVYLQSIGSQRIRHY